MKVHPVNDMPFGRIGIAARPRSGDWLEQDLSRLAGSGWTVLVSALERVEERELDLVREGEVATGLGLQYVSFPVPDRGLPDIHRTLELVDELKDHLAKGPAIAVHCRMGIGRSSMICGALMVACGLSPDTIWPKLASARGLPVPDTDEQREWLYRLPRPGLT